jgi:hypothetical protein
MAVREDETTTTPACRDGVKVYKLWQFKKTFFPEWAIHFAISLLSNTMNMRHGYEKRKRGQRLSDQFIYPIYLYGSTCIS